MPTLVLSTWSLPASRSLADAARGAGWAAYAFDENPELKARAKVVFYGGTDLALAVASRLHLALLEPPFDLLAKLHWSSAAEPWSTLALVTSPD
jgi:hypothetical protein